jgi:hypothetical protein
MRPEEAAMRTMPRATELPDADTDEPDPTKEPRSMQIACEGCARAVSRICTLLRTPRPPDEMRVCPKCLPAHEAEGWILVHSCTPGKLPLHGFICWACKGKDPAFRIVSRTGDPVLLERCEECAIPLEQDGWRKACVRGS